MIQIQQQFQAMMMKMMTSDLKDDHDDDILKVHGTELCARAVGLSNKKLVCIWRRELRSDDEIFMLRIKYIAQ